MGDSLNKRLAAIESDLEAHTVTVRLRSGQERELTRDEVMGAMRDAASGIDTPRLREIAEVAAFRDDPAGLIPWVQIATVIRHSHQLHGTLKTEGREDATTEQ